MEMMVSILRRSSSWAAIALVLAACDGTSSGPMPSSATLASASDSASPTNAEQSTPASTGAPNSNPAVRSGSFAYMGSHAGIYCYAIDPISGALASLNPPLCDSGILTGVATAGRFLYAAHVVNSSDPWSMGTGTLRAYQIDSSTGALTPLGGSEPPAGNDPVSITVDPTGRFVYAADYATDVVFAYAINPGTGALTPVSGSPFATGHLPNWVTIDPSGSFLYTANNGSTVSGFSIDPRSGALTPVPGSPFATAEAMAIAIDPAGKFAFVASLNSADVLAFTIDHGTGTLSPVPGSPFSTGCSPGGGSPWPITCSSTDLTVDTSGAFLYVTSGSLNTIAGFSIDPATGALTALTGSPFATAPAPFGIAARGAFVYVGYNSAVTSVATFAVNATSGELTQVNTVTASTGDGAYDFAFGP